jgi:hypothetical protein
MHYKANRQNHDFQIVNFIVGSCHTADGAFGILHDLRQDRDAAIKTYMANKLRQQAKIIRAKRMLDSDDEAVRLEGKADIEDIQATAEMSEANYLAALAELKTINRCIEIIQPMRKFAHLPDPEAHEAAQYDEWKLELIHRAENCLLTTGSVPTDQFQTMRMHPAFKSEILPEIEQIKLLLTRPDGPLKILNKPRKLLSILSEQQNVSLQ